MLGHFGFEIGQQGFIARVIMEGPQGRVIPVIILPVQSKPRSCRLKIIKSAFQLAAPALDRRLEALPLGCLFHAL